MPPLSTPPTRHLRTAARTVLATSVLLAAACNNDPAPMNEQAEVITPPPKPTPEPEANAAEVAHEIEGEPTAAPEPHMVTEALGEMSTVRASRELRGTVSATLRDGRRHARAGQFGRALTYFRAGLQTEGVETTEAIGPLRCEAGWAALQTQDPGAEQLLREGFAVHPRPSGRAACAYNLGRLYEQRAEAADDDEAATARGEALRWYAESLALRPESEPTRERYEALSESRFRASCGPLGTYTSLDLFCADAGRRLNDGDETVSCERLPVSAEGEGIGELALMAVQTESWGWTESYLLLKRGPMWHRLSKLGEGFDRSCAQAGFRVLSIRWTNVRGSLPQLEVVGRITSRDCELSPWERCMRGEGTERECEALSDEVEINEYARSARVVCAEHDGRYRCSLGSLATEEPRPHELLGGGPLPNDLTDHLVCSVFLTRMP